MFATDAVPVYWLLGLTLSVEPVGAGIVEFSKGYGADADPEPKGPGPENTGGSPLAPDVADGITVELAKGYGAEADSEPDGKRLEGTGDIPLTPGVADMVPMVEFKLEGGTVNGSGLAVTVPL